MITRIRLEFDKKVLQKEKLLEISPIWGTLDAYYNKEEIE